jgi:hypothetical protein
MRPDTIARHLVHRHRQRLSPPTISLHLTRDELVVRTPAKRPKGSHIRFQAAFSNACWQAGFYYLLTRPDARPERDTRDP